MTTLCRCGNCSAVSHAAEIVCWFSSQDSLCRFVLFVCWSMVSVFVVYQKKNGLSAAIVLWKCPHHVSACVCCLCGWCCIMLSLLEKSFWMVTQTFHSRCNCCLPVPIVHGRSPECWWKLISGPLLSAASDFEGYLFSMGSASKFVWSDHLDEIFACIPKLL